VYEAIFAAAYGWELPYIRSLSLPDFEKHAPTAMMIFKHIMANKL
jgi:hypothetical protein